ncbi:MAG: phospho-N-acetylmuramoyl-pentapeptide-transferase [Bacteroidales bacterium]|nr:phospho-N-acetylmuramoyl-pentapeptide-transferase [Bacteroidales bacterium]
MIYALFKYFQSHGIDFPGVHLMNYLSFRGMLVAVSAILLTFLIGRPYIRMMQRRQLGETIRDLGLEGQLSKKGTPTMGGVIILFSILIPVLLFCDLGNIYSILLIVTLIWCGLLGFADDYIKVFKHNKEGMSERAKLAAQIALGFIIGLTVCFSDDVVVREKVGVNHAISQEDTRTVDSETLVTESAWHDEDVVKSTKTTLPFIKDHEFDYKYLSPFKGTWGWYCKWAIYVLMIVLVITACSNGANLTDGMDGLSAGVSAIVGVVISILAWLSGNILDSSYLNIMYIPGTGEVAIFMAAFVGALIGFLWYNSFPAQVFMGDTGSLTIGGIIGVSAILIRKELLLPLLCGIFLVESVSVLIQRLWFKYTKKKYGEGRRVFKMTPLHHHYQKEGIPALITAPHKALPEAKIVMRFWIVGALCAVATLALLKVR